MVNLRQKQLRNPEAKLWDQAWRQLVNLSFDHPRIQLSTQLYIPFRDLFHGQLITQIEVELRNQVRATTVADLRDRLGLVY